MLSFASQPKRFRESPLSPLSRQFRFILLFSVATIFSLSLSIQFAVLVGAGNIQEQGLIDLNLAGGLLVGGLVGLSQWLAFRICRDFIFDRPFARVWVAATAIGWTVAVSFHQDWVSTSLQSNLLFGQEWFSPITFLVLAIFQWFVLRQQMRQSWQWLLLPCVQVLFIGILQIILHIAAFGLFISLLSNLENPSAIPVLLFDLAVSGTFHISMLSHSLLPAIGLCLLQRQSPTHGEY